MEQNITKKKEVNKAKFKLHFKGNDDNKEKYKIKSIWNSAVYIKKSETDHLLGLYHLILWKNYPKKENTWKPTLTVKYFQKLLSTFYKKILDKPNTILSFVNLASQIFMPTIKPFLKRSGVKQKQRLLTKAKDAKKCFKKS